VITLVIIDWIVRKKHSTEVAILITRSLLSRRNLSVEEMIFGESRWAEKIRENLGYVQYMIYKISWLQHRCSA
jgi:hypothetical protein